METFSICQLLEIASLQCCRPRRLLNLSHISYAVHVRSADRKVSVCHDPRKVQLIQSQGTAVVGLLIDDSLRQNKAYEACYTLIPDS